MEDLDKDFDKNENQGNKDFFDTDNNDNKNCEDVQASAQEGEKELEVEKENYEKEEETTFTESEMHIRQEEDCKDENETDYNVEQQNSSDYIPPYIPNFTVQNENGSGNYNYNVDAPSQKNADGHAYKVAFAVCFSILLVVLALVLCAAFLLGNRLYSANNGSEALDIGQEKINIVQNSPKLEITTNTDSDYVPKSVPEVVSMVGSSVVEIKTSSMAYDVFYGQYVTSGAGSGVIITQSQDAGYLLTNYHVIFDDRGSLAETITVVLTNGEEYEAVEIGNDESLDLALLRIEKKESETFTVAAFGNSSNLVVGQDVIAIGNPLGSLGGTVTNGIISALDRQVKIGDFEMTLLQHNAAINPGNSGGALFDMMGNLVGIVNAKTSDTGIEGLGFAIPSNIAIKFFERVMVTEPAIGIRVGYGKPTNYPIGIYVIAATNNSFEVYDRIVKVNGTKVSTLADYYSMIDSIKDEDSITITIQRKSGATMNTMDVKVQLSK